MHGGLSLSTRLPRLPRELESFVPGYPLRDTPPGPMAMEPGRCSAEVIERVLEQIGSVGGPAYGAMRAWTLLIWQPVLVAVLCAESESRVAEVDIAAFEVGPGFGCHLGRMPGNADHPNNARARAADHLRLASEAIFTALNGRVRLRRELAQRQLADRVLGILARRATLGLSPVSDTSASAHAWLCALDLRGASSLERLPLTDGSEGLWLCRRSCCLEYRARPGFLCTTCPKRTSADRVSRSLMEWEDHVRA